LEQEEAAALQEKSQSFQQDWAAFEEKKAVEKGIKMLGSQLDACRNMVLADDFKAMKRVLRRLEFTKANIVETKGRIACEISTSDEIIATELMLSGVLKDLPPDITVALLSCLVHEENSSSSGSKTLTEQSLQEAYGHLRSTATHIANIFRQCKLDIDPEAYVNNYKPSMMEPVLAWARGASFAQLCQMTDCFEGSIIRTVRRLHELLRQLEDASKAVGSMDLARKFQEGARLIEHGIVFAASLYL
jgi:ATP-dependent RNA helicase DOB1